MESQITAVLFYGFSSAAVISALLVITKKNPVTSAISLVVTFFSISAIYILLNSQFIAIMQVLIYAGAIMVLIIFVIMLLNLRPADIELKNRTVSKAVLVILIVFIMALSLVAIVSFGRFSGDKGGITPEIIAETGSVQLIARAMFSKYLLPFELVSLLITIAIIGVVILSRSGPGKENDGGE
ncbi:MAG TPA: NADH-quinone oxidoreductase subunit J [Spirochaetota bacterium]|nr:NADH-quinone oxidoreductase subunit J [Spirochaetota bacterium]